jgi:ubiquitin-conjugating enzyme E2 Q
MIASDQLAAEFDQLVVESAQDGGNDEDDDDIYSAWSPQSPRETLFTVSFQQNSPDSQQHSPYVSNSKIKADLCAAKVAGFKVGIIGQLLDDGIGAYVTVSCRISKLGISEEAMQSWSLDKNQYFILLLHYPESYISTDRVISDTRCGRESLKMWACTNSNYKLTPSQCIAAFATKKKDGNEGQHGQSAQLEEGHNHEEATSSLKSLFIDGPLTQLLNGRLLPILRIRNCFKFGWEGAEKYYDEQQGKDIAGQEISEEYFKETPCKAQLPTLVSEDHFGNTKPPKDVSLPLVAMQFILRHLVRCTEFCLVCHCRVEGNFEALKPYVCPRPLCLYQYMFLGLGPSIEYEIISQPDVVDILISFCFASAYGTRLNDFPTGMNLLVPAKCEVEVRRLQPHSSFLTTNIHGDEFFIEPPFQDDIQSSPKKTFYSCAYDPKTYEAIFEPKTNCPLKRNDWVVFHIRREKTIESLHCRVTDPTCFPTVKFAAPVRGPSRHLEPHLDRPTLFWEGNHSILPMVGMYEAEMEIYNQNFDNSHTAEKRATMVYLIGLLPSVKEMKAYLTSLPSIEAKLTNWIDRISPAALGVLRWIIASNRSCILRVEDTPQKDIPGQTISNMDGPMQFRFAQGAPDKEDRFVKSLNEATTRLDLRYPSIFAWHGSPISSWHGIIREGLNYNMIKHGRAHGNGCYHSLRYQTSLSYALRKYDALMLWPPNVLPISSTICLNEIVNAPEEYVAKSPHLVVSRLDWIQTRYLFVDRNRPGFTSSSPGNITNMPSTNPTPLEIDQKYPQDPTYTAQDHHGFPLAIPMGAVASSRRPKTEKVEEIAPKRVKLTEDELSAGEMITSHDSMRIEAGDDGAFSNMTDPDDLAILSQVPANVSEDHSTHPTKEPVLDSKSLIDWSPGTVDYNTLDILQPPSNASMVASKTLQRDLKALLTTQNETPGHELGWYIDPELVSNVYQWIIEMHSFDPELPLAQDMKSKNLKCILFEIRFSQDYPMSPPFVRVIRPRFVPLFQGGGGHVTQGGAMCMELLTNSGWSAVSSIESVLLQVRLAISSTESNPARLLSGPVRDYKTGEAMDAYIRSCRAHGWKIPDEFENFRITGGFETADGNTLGAVKFGGSSNALDKDLSPQPNVD